MVFLIPIANICEIDYFIKQSFLICHHFACRSSAFWTGFTVICRDHDGKVTAEEVAAAAAYLKDTIGKEGVQELISNLSKDKGSFTNDIYVLFLVQHPYNFLWFLTIFLYTYRRKDPCWGHCEASFTNREQWRGRGSTAVAGRAFGNITLV